MRPVRVLKKKDIPALYNSMLCDICGCSVSVSCATILIYILTFKSYDPTFDVIFDISTSGLITRSGMNTQISIPPFPPLHFCCSLTSPCLLLLVSRCKKSVIKSSPSYTNSQILSYFFF